MNQPRSGETLTQNVFGILVDAMLDQQLDELFLKSSLAVMRFLLFDIVCYCGDIRTTDTKRGITRLPDKGLL